MRWLKVQDGLKGNRAIRPALWSVVQHMGKEYPQLMSKAVTAAVQAAGDAEDELTLEDCWIQQVNNHQMLHAWLHQRRRLALMLVQHLKWHSTTEASKQASTQAAAVACFLGQREGSEFGVVHFVQLMARPAGLAVALAIYAL